MSFVDREELMILYDNHALFRALVDSMEEWLVAGRVSERLLRWAVGLAIDRAEMRRIAKETEAP